MANRKQQRAKRHARDAAEPILKARQLRVVKDDAGEARMVIAYAIVCSQFGEPYVDRHGDHIPEDVMLRAAKRFAQSARLAKVMHEGDQAGTVDFIMPLTDDIKKAAGLDGPVTGLLVGIRPDPALVEKVESGELNDISIGGNARYIANG